MIRHLVAFKLNDNCAAETFDEFARRTEDLRDQIPVAKNSRLMRNAQIRNDGADFVLEILFESVDDFNQYMSHPAHRTFVDECVLPWTELRIGFQTHAEPDPSDNNQRVA